MEIDKSYDYVKYLETLDANKLRQIIKDFAFVKGKVSKEYVKAKLHYQERNANLENQYRKENNNLKDWAKLRQKEKEEAWKKSQFWEGKFKVVKQENNKLRNKLFKKEKP